MNINIQTFIKTNKSLHYVFEQFNQEMFFYLTKNAPVKPLRYDGDEIGSEIHLQMLLPWKDKWVSVITERSKGDTECYFVDEGSQLPFNILNWKHRHILKKVEGGVVIEDAITFKSTNSFFNLFWWLALIPQFLIRKIQYKRYLDNQFK